MEDHLAQAAGPGAHALLQAAVGDAEVLSRRVRQVHHRPGRCSTATWELRLRDGSGERVEVLVVRVHAGDVVRVHAGDVVRVHAGDVVPQVWRFPDDPDLPGLAAATDEQCTRELLDGAGVDPGPVELRLRGYRPGRRVVVEVRTPALRAFVKVVRPSAVASLAERHRLLRAAGVPVPTVLGTHADGRLLLEALTGTSLRARLREGTEPLPGGADVLALLALLPPALCALPRRAAWTDDVHAHAAVTAGALPADADRCLRLADGVRAAVVDVGGTDEPVHGDLYEGQLLLTGGRISGLLDVDTAGPGRRADDLACLLGHAGVVALGEPAHADAVLGLAGRWLADFDRQVDPADLRARTAGVVVSLATGPHRVQAAGWQDQTRARLELAERWLAAAGGAPAPVRSSR